MITVRLEVPSELKPRPRLWKCRRKVAHNRPLFTLCGSYAQKAAQKRLMGLISTLLSILPDLPCSASMSVAVEEGSVRVEGVIVVLDEESLPVAESVGAEIESAAFSLAHRHPKISYSTGLSITDYQVLEILRS